MFMSFYLLAIAGAKIIMANKCGIELNFIIFNGTYLVLWLAAQTKTYKWCFESKI